MDNQLLVEIHANVLELVKQNAIIATKVGHTEAKLEKLEARLKPIEDLYITSTKNTKIALGAGALMASIIALVRLFK